MNRELFRAIRERINRLPSNFAIPFSEIFANLFGEINENMWSWLDAISSSFQSPDFNDAEVGQSLRELFEELNIDPQSEPHIHDFQFWAYLVTMYRQLGLNQYSKNDNIFAFMKDFRITETRVVIIGEDPPKNSDETSGYAYHLCQYPTGLPDRYKSHTWLIDYLKEHYELLSTFQTTEPEVAGINQLVEPENIKRANSLQGWIQQKVLLMNIWLTHNTPEWGTFTTFILRYINENVDQAVFIITGKKARIACANADVNIREQHLVLKLVHPINYNYPENVRNLELLKDDDWKRMLPFINANLFLSHHFRGTIDWKSVTNLVPANNTLEEMELFVTSLQNIADTAGADGRGQILRFNIPVNPGNPQEGSITMRWVGPQANGRYLQLQLEQ